MKRLLSVLVVISMALGITAFECASKEMTSAKMYINQKKNDKAIQSLEEEIAKNPKNDEAFYLLGRLQGDEGKIDEMITNFDKSLEISNKFKKDIDGMRLFFWGNNFNLAIGKFNLANKETDKEKQAALFLETIGLFEDAIKCEPDSVITYQNIAYAYFNAGKRFEAKETMKKALSLKPDAEMFVLLGSIFSEDEQYDEVIELAKEARKHFPEDSEMLRIVSNAYIATGKLDIALATFEEGISKEPTNKFYRYNFGSLLLNAQKYEEAIEQLKAAVEIDPEYTNAIYNLGVAYVNKGSKVREENEEKEIDSDEYKTYFKNALPLFEKYLETNPEDVKIWELLGQVYANLGETEKSKEAFDKADSFR
ncbi:MAG: tetratricopeptide repeat protein [Rhodothermaceae bacterium]